MNNNWGDWYRAAGIIPTNDMLLSRDRGIVAYLKNDISIVEAIYLLRLFYNIPVSDDIIEIFINSIYEKDKAFDRSSKNEIAVLAGITLFEICIKNKNALSTFIFSSMEAIIFNDVIPAVPAVQAEILKMAYQTKFNIRKNILLNKNQLTLPDYKNIEKVYKEPVNANAWNSAVLDASLAFFNEIQTSFSGLANYLNNQYKENLILFEDSQILWWITGKWSNDFKKPFSKIDYKSLPVYSGKELSDLICVLPGPYSAKAVLDVILQKHKAKSVNIFDMIFSVDITWKKDFLKFYNPENLIEITPVLYAIYKSCELDTKDALLNSLNKQFPKMETFQKDFLLLDIAFQVYNECLVIKAGKELDVNE